MRNVLFAALAVIGVILYRDSVMELASLSCTSELHQHIPLIPLVSGYLLFVDRKEIFVPGKWTPMPGLAMLAAGALVWGAEGVFSSGLDRNDYLSAMMAGLVLWAIGSFVVAYGMNGLRAGLFPLLFLAFIVPVPGFILDPLITFLQVGSAAAADFVFQLTGVPFLREGMIFSLPGIEVEVAKQCSGIRSSLALIITAVLAGKLFLNGKPGRIALVMAVVPITIFKNALRIVTLSILGSYVDPIFVTGHWLHRSGGIPFFVVGLALLSPVLWLLRRIERGRRSVFSVQSSG
jgi:exosortase